MTRRINQKLAVKRRKEEQEEELKAAKKAKKAEKKVEAEAKVNSGQTVIVDRLVAGGEEALRAHTLLASGEEVNVELFSTGSDRHCLFPTTIMFSAQSCIGYLTSCTPFCKFHSTSRVGYPTKKILATFSKVDHGDNKQ